jgi:hypothetical protein
LPNSSSASTAAAAPRPARSTPSRLAGAGWGLALLAAAALATGLLYGHTIGYGFHYDDYAFMRPHTAREVLASFRGSWDRTGIMVPFYRPLTVALHAVRFDLFGLDADAHHRVSLILFSLAASLAGLFAARATGRPVHGLVTTALFVCHPSMVYAQVAWITNQMHLASSVVALGALAWWIGAAAGRTLAWWLPLMGLGVAAFLFKEDGIILLPLLVVLHVLRRGIVDAALPMPPRAFLLGAVAVPIALVWLRAQALGELGGYGRPDAAQAWANFTLGLERVFLLLPAHRPWQPAASGFAAALLLGGAAAWRWASPGVRYLMAAGAATALAFNLPFVFVTKNEQMHMVAAGAALMWGGCAAGVLQALRTPALRVVSALVLAAGILACASVARHISKDFEPYGPIVLASDQIVRGWAAVPAEIRDYLARKAEPGAAGALPANPVRALALVAYGLHSDETSPDGVHYRWMAGPRAEFFVAREVRSLTLPLRHEAGAFGEPAAASITAGGRQLDALTFEDGRWRYSTLSLAGAPSGRGPMRRVILDIPHAWIPAERIPGSTDTRVLGLQVGVPELR